MQKALSKNGFALHYLLKDVSIYQIPKTKKQGKFTGINQYFTKPFLAYQVINF